MNERIKELAELATTKGEWSCVNNRYMEEFDKEKFAQLIVERLCYDMMDVCGATQAERIQFVAKDWGVE